MNPFSVTIVVLVIAAAGFFIVNGRNQFDVPKGATERLAEKQLKTSEGTAKDTQKSPMNTTEEKNISSDRRTHVRDVLITDEVKHSIPLNEILSGGPPKDGIPSVDSPKFVSADDARDFLSDADIGLGLTIHGVSRFYPYKILVWHEIVNDTVGGTPALVTYCPLCATGIVFDRRVRGEVQEFGVSGKLWKSNLLMYNRAPNGADESLWSQVLGEAVLGEHTGEKLTILRSDTVRFDDWKKEHSNTQVLSTDTGAARSYGRDPYGNYYMDDSVSFGATFNDTRLHPKALVLGIEVDGVFKAYHIDAIPVGESSDTFNGETITITKSKAGEIGMSIGGESLSAVRGFWFSWLAVHPETQLFK